MQAIRALIGVFVLFSCVMLSFKGFPLGIISFVGFMLLITGWTPAISAMFHPMGAPTSRRLIVIFIGFAIASLGRAVVDWSGLAFINIGSLKVSIAQLGAYVGIFGGLFNLDKSMSSSSNIFPDASLK